MLYILYESPNNVITSLLTKLYDMYPPSSRIFLSARPSDEEVYKVRFAPLLSTGWLVLANPKISKQKIKVLTSFPGDNVILLQVASFAEYEELQQSLAEFEPVCVDNHKIKKETVLQWIQEQLHCSKEIATYLYNRVHGRLTDLVEGIQILSEFPNVTRQHVLKYVQPSVKANISDIADYLMGCPRPGIKDREIVYFLYEFRYAFPWVLKSLLTELEDRLAVFRLVSDGALTIANYQGARKGALATSLPVMTERKLLYILKMYGQVSTEYLVWLISLLREMPDNRFTLYKVLQLVKIV